MAKYGLLIDVSRCNGCYNCQLACKDEFVGNAYPPYSLPQPPSGHFWMHIDEKERGRYPWVKVAYVPIPCMHCEVAPCAKASSDGIIYRRQDGIVVIDPEKGKGQKKITDTCPFGAIYWNEELQVPQKCTFCAHLLDQGWKEPRCVEACPTKALLFGDLENPGSEISKVIASQKVEPYLPELKTTLRVSYVGLPKLLVAGSVVFADTDECGVNAQVKLMDSKGKEIRTRQTNGFGDFEFDGIEIKGLYQLKVTAPGYKTKILPVDLTEDTFLGEIFLNKS